MGGSARAGHPGEVTAARSGKGHLAAAPDPPPPADDSQQVELAELIAAAVADLLEGRPRGAQVLGEAIQLAASMSTAEAIYAAVEAYASHVSAVYAELKDTDDLLQEARGQIAELEKILATTRSEAAVRNEMVHQLMNRERPAPPKRRRRAMPAPPDDVAGQDRRPDPETARTPAELMATLREFRQWAGTPPYRVMAEQSGWGASTLNTIINSNELPDRLAKIAAIITGCGGNEDDQRRFASAWRRLSMPGTTTRDANRDQSLPVVLSGVHSDRILFGRGGSGSVHITAKIGRGQSDPGDQSTPDPA